MKKLIITIVILLLIFLTMFFNTRNNIKNQEIEIGEIEEIEEYISKIYMWEEVTNEALPCFDNIKKAQDKWVFEVIKKNIDDYDDLTYDKIINKGKEIFGSEFDRKYNLELNIFIETEEGKYLPSDTKLDNINDTFIIDEIKKEKDKYNVQIIEYQEDYSEEEIEIEIKNLKGEKIFSVKGEEERQKIVEEVKKNKEKFNKKSIQLEKTSNGIIVKSVQ